MLTMAEGGYDYEETAPDRSKSDYYCPICQSYMHSYQMWESHIVGKRHLKNMNRNTGEGPSQVKTVKLEGERAYIQDMLDHCHKPLVGLSYITERRSFLRGGEHLYHCHLCQDNCTRRNIIEHLLTGKHRDFFFRHIKSRTASYLGEMKHLSKRSKDHLLEDAAREYEKKNGRDLMQVEVRKSIDWSKPARNKYPTPESQSESCPASSSSGFHAPSPLKSEDCAAALPVEVEKKPPVLTMSDVKRNMKRMSTDQKIRLCQALVEDLHCENVEELQKIYEVYESISKLCDLVKLRRLPNKLFKRLYLDVTKDPPTVDEVMTEIVKGKKSYYFTVPPKE